MDRRALQAYKEKILRELCTILREKYHEDYREIAEHRILELLSETDRKSLPLEELRNYVSIRYFLGFRNDSRLIDLRDAYSRIERGDFGLCLLCKCEIPEKDLQQDICKRICSKCQVALRT